GASLAPLWLLVLLVLPWLSPSLPAAFLLWSGPMALLVWIAIALSMAASLPKVRLPPQRAQNARRGPRLPPHDFGSVRLQADRDPVRLKPDTTDVTTGVGDPVRLKPDTTDVTTGVGDPVRLKPDTTEV